MITFKKYSLILCNVLLVSTHSFAHDKALDVCRTIKFDTQNDITMREAGNFEPNYRDIIAKAPDEDIFFVNAAKHPDHESLAFSHSVAGWIQNSVFSQFSPHLNMTFTPVLTWIAATYNPFTLFAAVNVPNQRYNNDTGFAFAYNPTTHQLNMLEGMERNHSLSGAKVSHNNQFIAFSYDYFSQNKQSLGVVFKGEGTKKTRVGELNLTNAPLYAPSQEHEVYYGNILGISDSGNVVLANITFGIDGEQIRRPSLFILEADGYQLYVLPVEGRAVGISSNGQWLQYIDTNKKIIMVSVEDALNPTESASSNEVATYTSYLSDNADCDFQTAPDLSIGFSCCTYFEGEKNQVSSAVWFQSNNSFMGFTKYMSQYLGQPYFADFEEEEGNLISLLHWSEGVIYGRRQIHNRDKKAGTDANFFACDPAYSTKQ